MDGEVTRSGLIDQPMKRYPGNANTVLISNAFFFFFSLEQIRDCPIYVDTPIVKNITICRSTMQYVNTSDVGCLCVDNNCSPNLSINFFKNEFQMNSGTYYYIEI